MTNREKTIYVLIAIGITLLIFTVYTMGRPKWDIVKLYEQKGTIVTQKAKLLQQDLEIRNKIDEVNKQIREIDVKLEKAINPQTSGFIEAWQPQEQSPIQLLDDYISGTKTESVNQSQQ